MQLSKRTIQQKTTNNMQQQYDYRGLRTDGLGPLKNTSIMGRHYLEEIRVTPTKKKQTPHNDRPLVLHGKLHFGGSTSAESNKAKTQSIRQRMLRLAEFSKLTEEKNQFVKMVDELSQLLNEKNSDEAASWRAKILLGSAQTVDKSLHTKILEYEQTYLTQTEDEEVRAAQSSCLTLHREFQQAHKSLVMALSLHKQQQRAARRVAPVGWTGQSSNDTNHDDGRDGECVDYTVDEMKLMDQQEKNASKNKMSSVQQEVEQQVDNFCGALSCLPISLEDHTCSTTKKKKNSGTLPTVPEDQELVNDDNDKQTDEGFFKVCILGYYLD